MELLRDFKKFLFRGNVVDLAVAVVVGTAFTALVKSLVSDLLTPIIGAIFGKPDFAGLKFTINGSVIPAKARRCPECTAQLTTA